MKTINTADEYLSGKEKGIKQRSNIRYELGTKKAQRRKEDGEANDNTTKAFLNRTKQENRNEQN